jgi:HSP20 family protein
LVYPLPLLSVFSGTKTTQQQETKMLYRMTTGAPIFGLRREIDRLFDDTFARNVGNFTPAVDIKENENEIRLDLELPGMRPEDVEITAENGVLTVRGEKQEERKEGDDNRYQVVERVYGTFLRTFQLPQGVDADQIKAEFNNGVLSLHIPKAALPQPKRIEIGSAVNQRQQAAVGSGSTSNQQNQQQNQQGTGKSSGRQSQRERETEMAAQKR